MEFEKLDPDFEQQAGREIFDGIDIATFTTPPEHNDWGVTREIELTPEQVDAARAILAAEDVSYLPEQIVLSHVYLLPETDRTGKTLPGYYDVHVLLIDEQLGIRYLVGLGDKGEMEFEKSLEALDSSDPTEIEDSSGTEPELEPLDPNDPETAEVRAMIARTALEQPFDPEEINQLIAETSASMVHRLDLQAAYGGQFEPGELRALVRIVDHVNRTNYSSR